MSQSLSNDDRALLHFAIAAVMNRRELYIRAARHHEAANLHQSAGKLAEVWPITPTNIPNSSMRSLRVTHPNW